MKAIETRLRRLEREVAKPRTRRQEIEADDFSTKTLRSMVDMIFECIPSIALYNIDNGEPIFEYVNTTVPRVGEGIGIDIEGGHLTGEVVQVQWSEWGNLMRANVGLGDVRVISHKLT